MLCCATPTAAVRQASEMSTTCDTLPCRASITLISTFTASDGMSSALLSNQRSVPLTLMPWPAK